MGSPLQAGTSSPRTWRCFHGTNAGDNGGWVFSTYVEVFLLQLLCNCCSRSLLHVRGGVSAPHHYAFRRRESSPRTWRCFLCRPSDRKREEVFSTYVEVFLTFGAGDCFTPSLLHVRGGVSDLRQAFQIQKLSSPRSWRCFSGRRLGIHRTDVFSTSVEVFPCGSKSRPEKLCLLHDRGGLSEAREGKETAELSSPRPRRCFPRKTVRRAFEKRLLHVRGGVFA